MVTGYCVKCGKKREMKNAKKSKKKGRTITKGKCPTCGTKMTRFGG